MYFYFACTKGKILKIIQFISKHQEQYVRRETYR